MTSKAAGRVLYAQTLLLFSMAASPVAALDSINDEQMANVTGQPGLAAQAAAPDNSTNRPQDRDERDQRKTVPTDSVTGDDTLITHTSPRSTRDQLILDNFPNAVGVGMKVENYGNAFLTDIVMTDTSIVIQGR